MPRITIEHEAAGRHEINEAAFPAYEAKGWTRADTDGPAPRAGRKTPAKTDPES